VTEIRSYRRVFDLERRIYRVDRLRLNPGGIPLLGVVYWLALLACALVARELPVAGLLMGAIPWYLSALALPSACAVVLSVIRIDGRPIHRAGTAVLGDRLQRSRSGVGPMAAPAAHECWRPEPLLFLPDGSDARLRRLRYTGPGAVRVSVAHERAVARGGLRARARGLPTLTLGRAGGSCALAAGEVIELDRGVLLHVR
jgi:hypothetical protein